MYILTFDFFWYFLYFAIVKVIKNVLGCFFMQLGEPFGIEKQSLMHGTKLTRFFEGNYYNKMLGLYEEIPTIPRYDK